MKNNFMFEKYTICFSCVTDRGEKVNIYEDVEIPIDVKEHEIIYWIDDKFNKSDFMIRHDVSIILNYYIDIFDELLVELRKQYTEELFTIICNTYMKILLGNKHLIDKLTKVEILKIALSTVTISTQNAIDMLASIKENVDKKFDNYVIEQGVYYQKNIE